MTADQYVASVIRKCAVTMGDGSPASKAANSLAPVLKEWAGQYLLAMQFSGSYAKGTAISLGTDVDIFVSLGDVPGQGMKEIYFGLLQFCADRGLRPQAQNVSVRVASNEMQVDLVPGRKQKGNTTDHTLYKRKKDSWVQTNVLKHIEMVRKSGRANEVRALKVWRARNHVDFPSFYLELTTIDSLKHNRNPSLAGRVQSVLQYLVNDFMTARVIDPANTNNVISDDLDVSGKRAVMNAAKTSLQGNWEQILW